MNMIPSGIDAYKTDQYTQTVDKVVQNGELPISRGICWSCANLIEFAYKNKKKRVPGVRKIVEALKKRGNCFFNFR